MIETMLFFHLVAFTAFVPMGDGDYARWDVVIMEDHTQFKANCGFQVEIEDGVTVACTYPNMRVIYIISHDVYMPVEHNGMIIPGFTYHMLKLWQYEKYGTTILD